MKKVAWSMDKGEYFLLKQLGFLDSDIARISCVCLRTIDRWKKREGIFLGILHNPPGRKKRSGEETWDN